LQKGYFLETFQYYSATYILKAIKERFNSGTFLLYWMIENWLSFFYSIYYRISLASLDIPGMAAGTILQLQSWKRSMLEMMILQSMAARSSRGKQGMCFY
jgi:hypothetical protein